MRAVTVFLFTLLIIPAYSADTPSQVMTKYFTAVSNEEFDSIGTLFHPEGVAKFRAGAEPLMKRALRERDGRQMFGGFIDPYNPKELRQMTDTEFMNAFYRWINTWRSDALSMIKDTEFKVLGHVDDDDKSQVVIRLHAEVKGKAWETLIIRATKEYEGTALLLVPSEVFDAADSLHQIR